MKKSILFLIADLCSRGAEHQMVTIATLLKREGFDVSFLCYHTNNFYEHILKENDIRVMWISLPNYWRRLLFVRKFIRNGHFNAVVSFLSTDNFINNYAAIGKHDWRVITGERSSNESMFATFRGRVFAWFQRFSDCIVCNSENAKMMWVRHFPQYQEKLRVIYNTVNLPEITSLYKLRDENRTHIVIAGAYAAVKDPKSLLTALTQMHEEQRNSLKIEWYGKKGCNEEADSVVDECERIIADNHLESFVSLNDVAQDIANIMNKADVVALFSKWEGLPNAICEGLSLGKPILMTRVSDFKQLTSADNGFLCEPSSPDSIRNALINVINTSDEDLLEMGGRSKNLAYGLFSSDYVLSSWEEVINAY